MIPKVGEFIEVVYENHIRANTIYFLQIYLVEDDRQLKGATCGFGVAGLLLHYSGPTVIHQIGSLVYGENGGSAFWCFDSYKIYKSQEDYIKEKVIDKL